MIIFSTKVYNNYNVKIVTNDHKNIDVSKFENKLLNLFKELDERLNQKVFSYLQDGLITYDDTYYKNFTIPKDDGTNREITYLACEISEIHSEIKEILYDCFLYANDEFPTCIQAFIKKRYSVTNAKLHKKNKSKVGLNLDLERFFPSISKDIIINTLPHIYPFNFFNKSTILSLANYVTINDELITGSPTSPLLANLVSIPLDYNIIKYLKGISNNILYTRYSDDISITSSDVNDITSSNYINIIDKITTILNTIYGVNKIRINKNKIAYQDSRIDVNKISITRKDNELFLNEEKNKKIGLSLANLINKILNKEEITEEDYLKVRGSFSYLKAVNYKYCRYLMDIIPLKLRYYVKTSDIFEDIRLYANLKESIYDK